MEFRKIDPWWQLNQALTVQSIVLGMVMMLQAAVPMAPPTSLKHRETVLRLLDRILLFPNLQLHTTPALQ
jgi:hypothetical protein